MDNTSNLISVLKNGEVVVMPTDTVYGLVCSALNPEAVAKMYEIKNRVGKAGTLIAGSTAQLLELGFAPADIERAEQFWPNAVSVVLPAPPNLSYLCMGQDSLAVRVPAPKWLQNLLVETGPLATTSANMPNEPTVATIQAAQALFGNKVALYVDGGDLSASKPSSIVRIDEDGVIETLR